jgi:hypothetical protein
VKSSRASDGISDGADFLIWQRQLGSTSAIETLAANVPESSSLVAAIIAAALATSCRRGLSAAGR